MATCKIFLNSTSCQSHSWISQQHLHLKPPNKMPVSDRNEGSRSSSSSDSEERMKKKDQIRNLVCNCVVLQHLTTNSSSLIPNTESLYNDGKGIQVSVLLIGLLPRPKTGEKRRANAKPPVTTKVVYIHEKTTFINGLTQIIVHTFKRQDLCRGGVDRDGNLKKKTSDLFSLAYTIPRTQLKDVEILSENDWGTFLEEAGNKPSAQGKLTIRERLVSLVSSFDP
jgi:hypothetical protein